MMLILPRGTGWLGSFPIEVRVICIITCTRLPWLSLKKTHSKLVTFGPCKVLIELRLAMSSVVHTPYIPYHGVLRQAADPDV